MSQLPIMRCAEDILRAAARGKRLIISSPPGSGKSTKVPQLLLDSGRFPGRIAVLEPRRLAARMLAVRVAEERGGSAGGEVGYRVRFDDKTGAGTRIVFETEGIMMRELISDPCLRRYSVVILDEFHERHIHGDLTLAACLQLQRGPRPDLLVAVMSATLDEKALADYLSPCETVTARGAAYPVRVVYSGDAPAGARIWDAAAKTCAQLMPPIGAGHTLIFMPGAFEINKTVAAVKAIPSLSGFDVRALHGDMPPKEQDDALAPSERRKIIIATNIAETSLTIEGVTAVIDSGLAKVSRFDGARGINTLFTENISAASAAQRAGRAGRTQPGVCARLWTERDERGRPASLDPEIKRVDISEALLALKAAGFKDFEALKWLDPPDPRDAARAEALLRELGASDGTGALTADGREMAGYPVHPRYSRMLVEASRSGCAHECALIAAAAHARGLREEGGASETFTGADQRSDPAAMVRALTACADENFGAGACARAGLRPSTARDAWRTAARLSGGKGPSAPGALKLASKCFLRAFPDRVAALLPGRSGRYQLPGGKRARLDPKSAASGALLLCAGMAVESSRRTGAEITLSFAAEITEEWLREAFGGEVKDVSRPALDKDMLSPVTEELTMYRDIIIRKEISEARSRSSSGDLIAEEFISGRHKFESWDEDVAEFLDRADFLSKTLPDLGIEALSGEDVELIMADICSGAKSVSDAKKRPVMPAIKNWFGWEKCRLIDRYAPARLEMPGGRKARIRYPRGAEPYLEAKIQDLFMFRETPRVAGGRVPLVVHILAPSMRPVQVTKDLKNFWAEVYPEIRPQLSRRYPKHKWP